MYQKVVLIGRLSNEISLRYTPNGNATCYFSLAVERKMKSSQGEKQTDFLSVVIPPFRGKLAELCSNFLDKGKLAMVEGEIHTRSYDDKDGNKRYVTEIEAETVKFLSPKESGGSHLETPTRESLGHEVSLDDDIPF